MKKWIRVELHTHTIASDGDMLPFELVENAKERGYRAIVVTDHNTTGCVEETVSRGKEEDLLVIEGIEWTTFWGHIVVTGGSSDVDWRTITLENIDEKIARARECGDLVTIAHPKRLGTPFCSECRFLFDLKKWENINAYEVWSHYRPNISPESKKTKEEWVSLIDKGYRIAPVYGYDWHTPDEGGPSYAYTYVGVEGNVTKNNVMEAIANSHTYISMGLEINCKISQDGIDYECGDELKSKKAMLSIDAIAAKEYLDEHDCEIKGMRLYKSDKMYMAKKWDGKQMSIPVELESGYFRIEVYGMVDGKDGDLAILSPFYIK